MTDTPPKEKLVALDGEIHIGGCGDISPYTDWCLLSEHPSPGELDDVSETCGGCVWYNENRR
jgi:hypothetical protein